MSELLTKAEEKETEQPGDMSRSVITRWWMLLGGVLERVVVVESLLSILQIKQGGQIYTTWILNF